MGHASSNDGSSAGRPAMPSKRRHRLLARLAAGRAELLTVLLELDAGVLTQEPFLGQWTVKDTLAHIAAWDHWEHRQMRRMLGDEPPEDVAVDSFNALVVAEWRDRPLADVVRELQDARSSWTAWLGDLTDEVFFQSRPFHDWDWAFPNCLEIQWEHDAEHTAQIAAWREGHGFASGVGPKEVLLAALSAAREELIAVSALVPRQELASRPVCGKWTLKDVMGHLADWEKVGVRGLRLMVQGQPLEIEEIPDIEAWNQEHADARRDQTWEEVQQDLLRTREDLVDAVECLDRAALTRSYVFPWGPEATAYEWIYAFIAHDREHAQSLREVLEVELDA